MMSNKRALFQGFTLIEVMVALAVFAVIALALTKNASLAVVQTSRMQEQLLAFTVAQNVMNELTSRGGDDDPFLQPTRKQTEILMANRRFQVLVRVEATSDADLKRLEVSVRDDAAVDQELVVLYGYVGRN